MLTYLDETLAFPDPNMALIRPNGLLAMGGDLSPERLSVAYQQGIFPWYNDDEPILWWSPDPRAVFDPLQFHINRTFNKFLKKCDYKISINHDFTAVIKGCAKNHGETWITDEIIAAYIQFHQLGFAHSVEVWQNDQLVGGLYGVAQGAVFCGESMFSLKSNASKVALYAFSRHFSRCGGLLIDCQVINNHTASLGAFEIPRQKYLHYLKQLQVIKLKSFCYDKQYLCYHS